MHVREAIRRSLGLLSRRDRRLLAASVLIQMGTSILDLVGVLLIGLVGALSVTTLQSLPTPSAISQLVNFLGLGGLSDQALVGVFAVGAASVLLVKSVVSSLLTRRVFLFLANRQAMVSATLAERLLGSNLETVQARSSQATSFALINGAAAATMQVLGFTVIALAETALLVVLSIALLCVSPLVAVGAILFFSAVGLAMQRALGGWAAELGRRAAIADVASLHTIQEVIGAYKEVAVLNRRAAYVSRFRDLRWEAARVTAEIQFIGILPKYVYDTVMILGGFVLAAVLLVTQNAVAAVGTLALFLAAATRIMPSLLRMQAAALGLRSAAGVADSTYVLAQELGAANTGLTDSEAATSEADQDRSRMSRQQSHDNFSPELRVKHVWYSYPGAQESSVTDISLHIPPGGSLALVGRSGCGKTTLADVILGLRAPQRGSVEVSGMAPEDAELRWPGAIAYVPQAVHVADSSVRANVALGVPIGEVDESSVWRALTQAHLNAFVESLPDGLDTVVGEGGLRMSGGQRQRLGIARALYTDPKLIVLDEATSALDAETEESIVQTIEELSGIVTRVVVAHRLSTVRAVDLVAYLDNGRLVSIGTFDEVRREVPALERQSEIMGLGPSTPGI